MFHCNQTTRALRVRAALLLCAALVTDVAIAAPPTLQSIAVTPTAASISVGQKQRFTATGTFSDGSTRALGAAVADIAPGLTGTCVLLERGGVDCWGDNGSGQLGDGSFVDSLSPRPVKWITNAQAVALGWQHGCAVTARGAVQCWGKGQQLGIGPSTKSSVPVRVTGIGLAIGVSAGDLDSCALLASGAVRCWGANYHGGLGDGTNVSSGFAVPVTGIDSAIDLATSFHSCAVLASGTVRCWGINEYGQLGNGTTIDSNVPVTVRGISNATAVATGGNFTCALLATGTVKCWGHGANAELGDGGDWPYANSSVPVSVAGISTAVAITAGGNHACAVLNSGAALCWGDSTFGQLGAGSTTRWSSYPVPVREINGPVKLVAGFRHTCALLPDGAMRCWGWNSDGQLGNRQRTGDTPNHWPANVIGTPGVTWESSDSLKATITLRGLATGRAAGNTTITATTRGFINYNAVLTVK
jgi:alpha-tubulin suppressor-like RCC1 family protein